MRVDDTAGTAPTASADSVDDTENDMKHMILFTETGSSGFELGYVMLAGGDIYMN